MPPVTTRETSAGIDFLIEEFDQWRNPTDFRLSPTRNTWCRMQELEPESTE